MGQDALVRETALDALLEIYSSEDNLSPLHGFTGRFQERFAELVYDVDEAVAVKGVRLVTQLVQAEEMPQDKVHLSPAVLSTPVMMDLCPSNGISWIPHPCDAVLASKTQLQAAAMAFRKKNSEARSTPGLHIKHAALLTADESWD